MCEKDGCLECDSRRKRDLRSWDLREKSGPRNLELTERWSVYPQIPCLSSLEGFFLTHELSITLACPVCDLSLLLRPDMKPQTKTYGFRVRNSERVSEVSRVRVRLERQAGVRPWCWEAVGGYQGRK